MGLLILTFFYLLPLVGIFVFGYYIHKDVHVARNMGINTWLALGLILIGASIPFINMIILIILIWNAMENDVFGGGLDIHKRK